MKLFQAVFFSVLVSVMSFSHADERDEKLEKMEALDALIDQCEEDSDMFFAAEKAWLDEVQKHAACSKKSTSCSKAAKDAAYAKRNTLMAKYDADKPACKAAVKQYDELEKTILSAK